jgi:hypothetical protein
VHSVRLLILERCLNRQFVLTALLIGIDAHSRYEMNRTIRNSASFA